MELREQECAAMQETDALANVGSWGLLAGCKFYLVQLMEQVTRVFNDQ